eukprot:g12340.t1
MEEGASTGKIVRFGWNGTNCLSSSDDQIIPPSLYDEITSIYPHKIRGVTLGNVTTIFVTQEGGLIGCGSDTNGILLGNGAKDENKTVKVPTQLNIKFKVLKCFCGATHAGAIDFFRNLHTWGSNEFGQLGRMIDIDHKIEYEPDICVSGTPVEEVALGFSHTIILSKEGKVMACGSGKKGQLGLGKEKIISPETQKWIEQYVSTHTPLPIKFFDHLHIISIAAGDYHSLFLDGHGLVYSCGDNSYGRLGYWSETFVAIPQKLPVFGSKKYRKVIHSTRTTCDEEKEGVEESVEQEKCNGNNKNENKCSTESYQLKALKIGSGGASNYAIANDNNVYTWGFNSRGQLGLGSFDDTVSPRALQCFGNNSEIIIIDVAMGEDHTIYLSESGNLYGCGLCSSGRLGINVSADNGKKKDNNYYEESYNEPFLIPNIPLDGDPLTNIACGGAHFVGIHIIEDQIGFVQRMRKQITEAEIAEKKRLAILNHEKELLRQKKEAEEKEKETVEMFRKMQEEFDRVKKEMKEKKEFEERQRQEVIEKKKREEEAEKKRRQIERERILMEKKRQAQQKREAEELAKIQRERKRKEDEKAKAIAEKLQEEQAEKERKARQIIEEQRLIEAQKAKEEKERKRAR